MVYVKMVNFLKKRQMKANTIAFRESKLTNKQDMTGVSYLKSNLSWVSLCVQSTIFYVA